MVTGGAVTGPSPGVTCRKPETQEVIPEGQFLGGRYSARPLLPEPKSSAIDLPAWLVFGNKIKIRFEIQILFCFISKLRTLTSGEEEEVIRQRKMGTHIELN